ncbi:hypothetical protein ACK2FX_18210 [Clostridioides difficile]
MYSYEIFNRNSKKERLLVFIYLALGIGIELLNSFSANYYQSLIDRFNNSTINFHIIFIYGTVLVTLCLLRYIDEYPGRRLEHSFFRFEIKGFRKNE